MLYQRLELGIAVTGLAVSLFVLRGGAGLDALARVCEHAGALSGALRALLFSAMMLVPATLMGGTLPVLARALSEHGHSGRALGLLYACNTLGAIAGALAPDFVLIPALRAHAHGLRRRGLQSVRRARRALSGWRALDAARRRQHERRGAGE